MRLRLRSEGALIRESSLRKKINKENYGIRGYRW